MKDRIAGLFIAALLSAAPVHAAQVPFKYEPSLANWISYSQIVCSATILDVRKLGTKRIEGEERNEYLAEAVVDTVFRGDPGSAAIQFRFYDFAAHPTADYFGSPTADFRSGSRYLVFLKAGEAGLEVAVPVWKTEIDLAPRPRTASAPALVFAPLSGIAGEILNSIRTEPKTLGRTATRYFSWVEEVVGKPLDWAVEGSGKDLVPAVEPFLDSTDELVRYQAAWWLSFRKLSDTVLATLRSTTNNAGIEEWARKGAGQRLEDIRMGNWVPK